MRIILTFLLPAMLAAGTASARQGGQPKTEIRQKRTGTPNGEAIVEQYKSAAKKLMADKSLSEAEKWKRAEMLIRQKNAALTEALGAEGARKYQPSNAGSPAAMYHELKSLDPEGFTRMQENMRKERILASLMRIPGISKEQAEEIIRLREASRQETRKLLANRKMSEAQRTAELTAITARQRKQLESKLNKEQLQAVMAEPFSDPEGKKQSKN